MKKLIHVTDDRGRLHCDNGACKHVLAETLEFGPHLIGYPCPKCGSDMLTLACFEASERAMRIVSWINRWFGWLGSERIAPGRGYEVGVRNHDGKAIIDGPRRRAPLSDTHRPEGS